MELLQTRRLNFHKSNFCFLIKLGLHIEETPGITGLHNVRGYLVHPRMIIILPVFKNPHRKRFSACVKKGTITLLGRNTENFCTSSIKRQEQSVLKGLLSYYFSLFKVR